MRSRLIAAGVVTLSIACLSPGAAAQPAVSAPPNAPPAGPADPFAHVPSGQVLPERTARGVKIVSNVPGNRYTLELVGKNVKSLGHKEEGEKFLQLWDVDGFLVQVLAMPVPENADPSRPRALLSDHMKYESAYHAEKGWKEVEKSRAWLKFPTGERVLYWEMIPPKGDAPPPPTEVTKMMAANTLNGRGVIMLVGSLLPTLDEAKARRMLTDTLMGLVRFEKPVATVDEAAEGPSSGSAFVTLLNDDLATRKDKKMQGAVVLKPEKLIQVLRMALELQGRAAYITMLYDGVAGHCINMAGYDRRTKEFLYWDTLGDHSFLEAANNHAGVNARRSKNKERSFCVTEEDFLKVLQGVMVDVEGVRHFFRSGTLEEAVQEYRQVKEKFPQSREWTEAWLLKAAQLLMEIDENARAFNIYAACLALHEDSARALAGIASVYARIGRLEPAANFYNDAIKKLPQDPSLDDARRKQLAGEWESARRTLTAKPAK